MSCHVMSWCHVLSSLPLYCHRRFVTVSSAERSRKKQERNRRNDERNPFRPSTWNLAYYISRGNLFKNSRISTNRLVRGTRALFFFSSTSSCIRLRLSWWFQLKNVVVLFQLKNAKMKPSCYAVMVRDGSRAVTLEAIDSAIQLKKKRTFVCLISMLQYKKNECWMFMHIFLHS